MREIVFRITFHFFRESDRLGGVKEYPLDADMNDDGIDGPLNDGPVLVVDAAAGSSGFASASLSPHTS